MSETDRNVDEENNNTPTQDTKKYLPYLCEVTESMLKRAETRLGETPERREKCLNELRELLESEEDLDSLTSDEFLLIFLRSRNFDVKRAFNLIRRCYTLKRDYEHLVVEFDLSAPQRFADSNIIGFLPHRDPQGRAILYFRPGVWEPEELTIEDAIYGGLVVLLSCFRLVANQIMGFVVIIDCENLPITQMLMLAPKYLFVVSHGLQYCCPCKVTCVHIINPSGLIDVAVKLVRPVIKDELWNLVKMHECNNYESLYEYIPKEILPSECGGDQGPFNNEHWVQNVPELREEYDRAMKSGYKNKSEKYFFGLF